MIDPGLDGRVAIVTGLNNPRGIGAAIAHALAGEGVRVFGTYFRSEVTPAMAEEAGRGGPGEALYRALSAQAADAVVDAIRATGGQIEAIEIDLSDPESAAVVFDRAESAFGPAEILVNNAAYSLPDSLLPESLNAGKPSAGGIPIAAFNIDRHDRHFQVNVRAPMLLMREVAARLIARRSGWGRIISVSTDGASGFPTEVSYGASKHALESFTRAAASELGPHGITANIVSLGPIQTGYITPDAEQRIARGTPLQRVGEPQDVADVVTFLVSHQARWVTGQLVYVGGGHAMSD